MNKKVPVILVVLSVLHFCVDYFCASSLLMQYVLSDLNFSSLAIVLIVYNAFAFLLQPLFGFIVDKIGNDNYKLQKKILGLSLLLLTAIATLIIVYTLLGSVSLFFAFVIAILLGLGNAFFHSSAGKQVLRYSNNSTFGGIFVSTGAIGIGLATIIPVINSISMIYITFIIVLIITLTSLNMYKKVSLDLSETKYTTFSFKSLKESILVISLICLAVGVRSFLGYYNSLSSDISSWNTIFLVSFAAFIGKAIGGVLLDLAGPYFVVTISSILSTVLSIFLRSIYVDYVYILSFNLLMPVTLDILRRCFKNKEGFAFGLAASFLFPGYIIGSLLKPYGIKEIIIPIICLLTGVIIIICYILTSKNKKEIKNEY